MKFTFFTLILAFAVFFSSIELGRSQQTDPDEMDNSRSGAQRPLNPRQPQGQRHPQTPINSQGVHALPVSLAPLGTHPSPLDAPRHQGPRLPVHYVSPARRHQYNILPEYMPSQVPHRIPPQHQEFPVRFNLYPPQGPQQ